MTDLFPINRHDKIGELKREIAIRRRVYRDQVFTNRMTREMADRRIAVMEAILADYEAQASLFDAIAHGDNGHRAWLKEAIDAHFAGQPVPEPRGVGKAP